MRTILTLALSALATVASAQTMSTTPAQTRPQSVRLALRATGKNADACDTGNVGKTLNDVGQERIDVLTPTKHSRKTQQGK